MDLILELFLDPLVAVSLLGGLAVLGILMSQQQVGRWFQRVHSQWGDLPSACRLSGAEVATRLLRSVGLQNIPVKRGGASNHYHPRLREIQLNAAVSENASLAALATAAHEVGHAWHFAEGIWQCRLRGILWPICWSLVPLVCGYGFLMAIDVVPFSPNGLSMALLVACLLVVALQAPISLPLESDASRRARRLVIEQGLLAEHERPAFDRLLRAAWKTHAIRESQRWIVLLLLAGGMAVVSGSSLWDEPSPFESIASAGQPVSRETIADPYQSAAGDAPAANYRGMPPVVDIVADLVWLTGVILLAVWVCRYMPVLEKKTSQPTTEQRAVLINNEGMDFLERGETGPAIEKFSESLKLNPRSTAVWFNRGQAHSQAGDFRAAVTDFNRAIELAPPFMEAVAGRGKARFLMGEFEQARHDCRQVLAADPWNETALHTSSDDLVRQGNFAAAAGLWSAAIERNPNRSAFYRHRGMVHFMAEHFPAAIADCDRAIELNPGDAIAWNNRGAARIQTGDYDGAIADLDKALQLDPEFPNPRRHLAWIQATCPLPAFRDGIAAVANATQAMEMIHWRPCEWLEVLAAAAAEAGDFGSAERWQQGFVNALQTERDHLPADQFQLVLTRGTDRLRQYQNNQPLRDGVTVGGSREPPAV